jgi:hypothetical protein
MPFPSKKHKSKKEEHYNRFCEWIRPLFLQIPLTDAIKMPPYSKYMKDILYLILYLLIGGTVRDTTLILEFNKCHPSD